MRETLFNVDRLLDIFGLTPSDTKNIDFFIKKFLRLNKEAFKFLEILASEYHFNDKEKGIKLQTSRYAGAIPLRSPKDEKWFADLIVKGSYSYDLDDENIFLLLEKVDALFVPDFCYDLKLLNNIKRPPIYIEYLNFIDTYIKARNKNWTQFVNTIKKENNPRGATNWVKNSITSYCPSNLLNFENKINIRTVNHYEWKQINYVLHLCIDNLSSNSFGPKLTVQLQNKIKVIKSYPHWSEKIPVTSFHINSQDPIIIKELKRQANAILRNSINSNFAWRIDIAELYERYIQYLIQQSIENFGWKIKKNPRYPITRHKERWMISYLEPDIIINKGERQIVVDVKYKSNLLNINSTNVNQLKEAFRYDLHQLIAYSALNNLTTKEIYLIYPYPTLNKLNRNRKIIYTQSNEIKSPDSTVKINLHLLGIPMSPHLISHLIQELRIHLKTHRIQ